MVDKHKYIHDCTRERAHICIESAHPLVANNKLMKIGIRATRDNSRLNYTSKILLKSHIGSLTFNLFSIHAPRENANEAHKPISVSFMNTR